MFSISLPLVVHLFLAVILFYIINWFGAHSLSIGYMQLSLSHKEDEAPAFNFIYKTFAPVVFIIFVSTVFYYLDFDHAVKGIWKVVIYYFVLRWLLVALLGRGTLQNWKLQISYFLISSASSYFIYEGIIKYKIYLLPDLKTLTNEIWLLVVLFIYGAVNRIELSTKNSKERRNKYVIRKYQQLLSSFSELVNSHAKDEKIKLITYSIMIYENYNRPKLVRIFEKAIFPFFSKTLGIMQVVTEKKISDKESIVIAIDKINQDYESAFDEEKENWKKYNHKFDEGNNYFNKCVMRNLVRKYNHCNDYVAEVMDIYDVLS